MTFSPTPQKKEAGFVSVILLVLSLASFLFSNIDVFMPLPLQLISLVCAVAGVYVAVRYVFTQFTYSINGADFCVSKSQGSRPPVTECRLALKDLSLVTEYTDDTINRLREKHGKVSLYYYTVSMLKSKRHALVFDDNGDCICVIIEADARFITALTSYASCNNTEI